MRLRRAAVCGLAVLFPFVAFAQAPRTFVASTGLDTNPCSRQLPCRNFSAAVAATDQYGEVVALDSAGYGPVTIATALSLIAPEGVYAGITAFSGDAIVINGAANTVTLRGLTLNGEGGVNGINATTGEVFVEHCRISRFSGDGLVYSGIGQLHVFDLLSVSNGGRGLAVLPPTGGSAIAEVERSVFDGNFTGVVVGGSVNAALTIRDSLVTHSFLQGIGATAAILSVKNCTSSGNRWGVYAFGGAHVSVSNSLVTNNTDYGFFNSGSTFWTYGNNVLRGNGNDTTGNNISLVSFQ